MVVSTGALFEWTTAGIKFIICILIVISCCNINVSYTHSHNLRKPQIIFSIYDTIYLIMLGEEFDSCYLTHTYSF